MKGSPAAIADVVGGQVDIMIDNMSSIAPFGKDGRLKPLAITSTTRSQLFPDVPTVAETVLPGFESVGWGGFVAPAGTPKATITKLNAVFNEVLHDPQMKEKLLSMGMETAGGSEEEFRKYAESEAMKWRPIIEKANIQVN
ncbi:tripartite tricarboxylate transporter substrate-binding protein [Variovorax sp.]|uniref:tripartite tricarboxylate transporter substrate-binding protein n=1 Tax=Variovorax sp. TaxID=1871043 RepID=UPI0025CEF1E7|nr:tripartite tricarboxylate transporter substrate-binding protein [Variovorax sp.]